MWPIVLASVSKCFWQVSVKDRPQGWTARLFSPLWLHLYHPWPVDGDVNLLWLRSWLDASLLTPSFSLWHSLRMEGSHPVWRVMPSIPAPFEDHEIVDPRRTISAFGLLTGNGLTRDYNVTGMSQTAWLSLWADSHLVAQCTQEGIMWSIKGHLSPYCRCPLYSSCISLFGRLKGMHTKLMPTLCIFTRAPCIICPSQKFTSSCLARVCVAGCVCHWAGVFPVRGAVWINRGG